VGGEKVSLIKPIVKNKGEKADKNRRVGRGGVDVQGEKIITLKGEDRSSRWQEKGESFKKESLGGGKVPPHGGKELLIHQGEGVLSGKEEKGWILMNQRERKGRLS